MVEEKVEMAFVGVGVGQKQNIVMKGEDILFGGSISRSQVRSRPTRTGKKSRQGMVRRDG